jgi:hypothetical protein
MDPNVEALVELAQDLTDKVESLENQNAQLRAQSKQASVVRQAPVVDEETASSTCGMLVNANLITPEQSAQTKQAFLTDPKAVHRALHALIDAQAQTKTASVESVTNVNGGVLVTQAIATNVVEDHLENLQKILGIF